ncbi:MAG TPA: hypothetical protein DCL44_12045 [Elusimicrobia bacterium]|nr:hypothetical protein [Elusimicrobiota bacterium]
MKKVLFVNAPSCFDCYSGTRLNAVVQVYPVLAHAILAALARQEGSEVRILDLGIMAQWRKPLRDTLEEFKPDLVCMSGSTPLIKEISEVSRFIREVTGPGPILAAGGPHPTALPEDTLRNSAFDMVVIGEGENPLRKLIGGTPFKDIPGVCYRDREEIITVPGRLPVMEMDEIPFPALDLYELNRYAGCSRTVCRRSPVISYMTSRGCVYNCSFCGKNIFGSKLRLRSPQLVIEEISHLLRAGIREIRLIDDMFTTDMPRAKRICELIIQSGLKFPWILAAGLRVDKMDLEFLKLAKRAGAYQVCLGFESGDQKSLDSVYKGTRVEDGFKAVELAKKAGLETVGFFMFGLPADTEDSLKKTIAYAKKLSPTYAKVTVTVPLPGSALYEQYKNQGLLTAKNWEEYNLHLPRGVYRHPNLSADTLEEYYNRFYSSFYLRPSYLLFMLWKAVKEGLVFEYARYGLQTFLPSVFRARSATRR